MNVLHNKKFRYGSVSVALTVVIIAAVILLNAIFTALSQKFVWYIDMTAEEVYTLSDEAKGLLDQVDPAKPVTVIFCTPKDELEANASQRYVLYTVMEMAKEYENISIRYVDIYTNPSAVSKYEPKAGQAITPYSVIVVGTVQLKNPNTGVVEAQEQSRVYSLNSLFTYDSAGSEIIGYNGEQRLVSAILAVTQVETPIACYTTTHGETDHLIPADSSGSPLLTLLYETGYQVEPLDLIKGDIPAGCSLILIFNPQDDFKDIDGISELKKLDEFMAEGNSIMTFFDNETPVLPKYEAFLKEWGVEISRLTTDGQAANHLIKDTDRSYTPEGYTNAATYATAGLGASITRHLRESNNPKDVVFPYACAIKTPYETIYDDENGFYYGAYYSNAVTRSIYDVFTSSDNAIAYAGGSQVTDAKGPFKYMTVTRESVTDASGNKVSSYLLACSSTDFVMSSLLDGGYGNHTVLARACHELGGAQVSVSLACKYFTDLEINTITSKAANQYTVVLTVVPASLIFIAGIVIMVRRKYA